MWTIEAEAQRVVPPLHGRQAIRNLAAAAAELDVDRPVGAFRRRNVVDRLGIIRVLLVVARGNVEADRPEAVDRLVRQVL